MKLFYSPGSVSMAVHMVLRELDLDFELVRTATGDGAHLAPAYLAVNPVGRVPALVVDGQVLTETPAILRFLARSHPSPQLYPRDDWARARCDEILSRIASLAQPSFRMVVRPDRVVPSEDETVLDVVRRSGLDAFLWAIGHLETALPDDGWAVGADLSIADPYLALMWSWARFAGGDISRWPRLQRIARAMLARPSARACMAAEGLVDADGRPTPPARV